MGKQTLKEIGTARSFWFDQARIFKLREICHWLGLDQSKVMRLLIDEKHAELKAQGHDRA